MKVWLNGHEHSKRAAARAGIGFTELSNGFARCDDPDGLRLICDRLGPRDIQAFFDRWMSRLPLPLTPADRAAGYWWELSMRQVEVSRTIVFDAPRQARAFFEALVADNLDLGRPEHVEILFKRSPRGRKPKDPAGGAFKTAIDRNNNGVTINAFWRHSRVKQYLKDGRALRVETVVNSPDDLGVARRLHHLPELQARARAVNTRLLQTEKVGQGCVFDSPAFARISQPTLTGDGRRAPGLRFGDPRVMALAGALANMLCAVTGITNKSLRALMTGLPGNPYSMNQASYDLARLSRNGLITRIPHRNLYVLTPTACGSRSSTPRSTTASCARSWRATSPRLRPRSAPPFASSTVRSLAASPLPGCQQPPDQPRSGVHAHISGSKTQDRCQSPSSQARLAGVLAATEPVRATRLLGVGGRPGIFNWRAIAADALIGLGRLDDAETALSEFEDAIPAAGLASAALALARCGATWPWPEGLLPGRKRRSGRAT